MEWSMNAALLIDAIVRQTTVLIAALATAAGQRAPLARVADQVFADLVRELNDQGVGHKVIADMFGMALRTYHGRISRLTASGTEQGRSLWEAVLTHLQQAGPSQRADVLTRFSGDNEAVVRGVLHDLVESGLVYQTGRGDGTGYRAAAPEDALKHDPSAIDHLVLVAVHRYGPVERGRLAAFVPANGEPMLDAALGRLVQGGTVRAESVDGTVRYDCETCVIPFGDSAGWEAAVFDHYQAMVTAVVTKLRMGNRRADLSDKMGGSTFVFDLWRTHPMADEALGYLKTVREQGIQFRKRLEEYNARHPRPEHDEALRVIAYVGQTVKEEERDEDP
jgi:hypothetical protein